MKAFEMAREQFCVRRCIGKKMVYFFGVRFLAMDKLGVGQMPVFFGELSQFQSQKLTPGQHCSKGTFLFGKITEAGPGVSVPFDILAVRTIAGTNQIACREEA